MPNIYARYGHKKLPAGNAIVWGRTFPNRKPQVFQCAPGQEPPWPASTLPDSDEVPFDGGKIVSVKPEVLATKPESAPTPAPTAPDAAWLAACMQRTIAKHHPSFHVKGPVMATVKVRKVRAADPVYRKRSLAGREVLTAKSCYLGKKGQMIFCFEPTSGFSVPEMAEIQSLEFSMDDAVEHLQDFKAFAVDILTQLKADPDMIPATTTEEEMIKVLAINNDKSKEQHANWGSW